MSAKRVYKMSHFNCFISIQQTNADFPIRCEIARMKTLLLFQFQSLYKALYYIEVHSRNNEDCFIVGII
jgi:hypothetical protein